MSQGQATAAAGISLRQADWSPGPGSALCRPYVQTRCGTSLPFTGRRVARVVAPSASNSRVGRNGCRCCRVSSMPRLRLNCNSVIRDYPPQNPRHRQSGALGAGAVLGGRVSDWWPCGCNGLGRVFCLIRGCGLLPGRSSYHARSSPGQGATCVSFACRACGGDEVDLRPGAKGFYWRCYSKTCPDVGKGRSNAWTQPVILQLPR